ncbi:MAG TPA: hypothetical protein VHN79_05460 [Lacunisphaera sp.]|nr:hypothetical protein [Lacunisphaera sp.]
MVHQRLSAHRTFLLIAGFFALFLAPVVQAASGADGYPAKIRSAHILWEKDSHRISDLLEKLRGQATTLNRLDKDIADARDEIRRLGEELARQLAEMAQGKFCSRCLNIASEIERGGQSFYAHLLEVNGVEMPASPEQLEQARQRSAEKVARIRERIARLEGEKKTATGTLNDYLHQLNVTIASYHRHITDEKTLQIAAWGAESNALREKLEDLQRQQEALARQPPSPAREVQARALAAQLRSSVAATSAAEARAAQTANAFNQGVRHDMDGLAKKATTIPSGQPLVDGWFLSKQITSQNITYAAFPVRRPEQSNAAQILKGDRPASSGSAPTKSVSDLLKGK